MAGRDSPLTPEQGFALLFEQTSARQLLANGTRTLADARYWDSVQDTVLTTLSIGAEKLLKLALGLRSVKETGAWPSGSTMRNTYRHDIGKMDEVLRTYLRSWSEATGATYVRGLVADVDADPVWSELARALTAYGDSGRFYHLDTLADSKREQELPSNIWIDAENLCIESNTNLSARRLEALSGTQPDFDAFILEVRRNMASSIVAWWQMVARAGQHGAFGDLGRSFGSDVSPGMALPPVATRR